uniref:Uncharacterized protein n=1 Tax=Arundo donax TaxID=35708 RepID=A0A0A8ZWH3_ARUDO
MLLCFAFRLFLFSLSTSLSFEFLLCGFSAPSGQA